MTVRATWNGAVVAEADDTFMVEGNHYFPPDAVKTEYLTKSKAKSVCPWKGMASYYTITVDGVENRNGAWTYRRPFPLARKIKNHVAFYGDVEISTAN